LIKVEAVDKRPNNHATSTDFCLSGILFNMSSASRLPHTRRLLQAERAWMCGWGGYIGGSRFAILQQSSCALLKGLLYCKRSETGPVFSLSNQVHYVWISIRDQ